MVSPQVHGHMHTLSVAQNHSRAAWLLQQLLFANTLMQQVSFFLLTEIICNFLK